MISINSHQGPYTVEFYQSVGDLPLTNISSSPKFYLIDRKVHELHLKDFKPTTLVLFDALEENKSIERLPQVLEELLKKGIKRNCTLVTIGGGITQDVACFIASCLFRGIDWEFYPTTLLAQADSCIGSKSSINFKSWKNILGNFNPPTKVGICAEFRKTLGEIEMRSGIGEILKIHALENQKAYQEVSAAFEDILTSDQVCQDYIKRSLLYKKRWIELDEFDEGPRNLLNYGHSFGHAIESATDFGIPHGIAVTLGMDIANFVAFRLNRITEDDYCFYKKTLMKNLGSERNVPVSVEKVVAAISKDKKNVGQDLMLILPGVEQFEKVPVSNNPRFADLLTEYFENPLA